jgi:predicted nucleic acid-binding protein
VFIAGELDHPVYDCFYLALAELERTILVTADTRLLGKVGSTSWEERVVDLKRYSSGSLAG